MHENLASSRVFGRFLTQSARVARMPRDAYPLGDKRAKRNA